MKRDQTKVCAECKHAKKHGHFTMCAGVVDLVTGRTVEGTAVASRGKKGVCGPDGKLFDQKTADVVKLDTPNTERKRRY